MVIQVRDIEGRIQGWKKWIDWRGSNGVEQLEFGDCLDMGEIEVLFVKGGNVGGGRFFRVRQRGLGR